jgi:hypothetical protein
MNFFVLYVARLITRRLFIITSGFWVIRDIQNTLASIRIGAGNSESENNID